jgi:hypothetical protein
MATGEWLCAPKGDLEQVTTLAIVEVGGRPSFFREGTTPVEPKTKEAHAPVSGAFTEDVTGDDPNDQRLSHGNETLARVRTSNGSSTAETTQSDSSQDTSPRKGETPTPEVCQWQNKGTELLNSINCHLQAANMLKVDSSVGSSQRCFACDTYAFIFVYCSPLTNGHALHTSINSCSSERQERYALVISFPLERDRRCQV